MIGSIKDLFELWKELLIALKLEDWLIEILTFVPLVIFFLVLIIWGLYNLMSWLLLTRKQSFLIKDLHPFFTDLEIDKATRYYIETKYQDTPPSHADEPGRTFIDSPKAKLIPLFLKKAFRNDDNRFYMILADAGMGKTTFMINLYLQYKRKNSWGRPKYNIRMLPLGNPNTLKEIETIPDKENTILLLDALDEDHVAIYNYEKRLSEILGLVWRFREVVITCRTQFFPSREEEPHETGFSKYGTDGGELYFRKVYISVFDNWDILLYLFKRYNMANPLNWWRFEKAWNIVKKSPNLMVRPMLLSHIQDLAKENRAYDYAYQIYEVLIERWLDREARKPGIKQKYGSIQNFKNRLYNFSQKLAVNLYENRAKRGGLFIHMNETLPTVELQLSDLEENFKKLTLKESEQRSRSLLNRDVEGKYKFSHKSILEYFLAKEALENQDFFKSLRLSGMEAANNFLLDMLFEKEIETWQLQKTKMSRKELLQSVFKNQWVSYIAWTNLGIAYYDQEEYDKAVECYQKAISIKKDYYPAWNNLGSAYADKKDYDKAIEYYQKSLSIKKYYYTWNNLGNTYKNKEEYDKAIECYQKAIDLKKEFYYAWNNLGDAYKNKEEYDKAIEYYQKAISIKKDYHVAWNNLGDAYRNKEEYDKAIEYYEEAISIKKDYHIAWNNLGITYSYKKEYDKAIECYEKAISIKENSCHYLNNLGAAYADKEDYDKAIEYCQKATAINPDFVIAFGNWSTSLMQSGAIDLAEPILQKVIELGMLDYGYMDLGHLYLCRGERDKAVEYYKLSFSNFSDKAVFWEDMTFDPQPLKKYGITEEQYQQILTELKAEMEEDNNHPSKDNDLD